MELMQMEMFVAVVEERSFLLAAERVFRTQPAVSIGIRKLEQEMGVQLLDRSRRQSGRLTLKGEMFYEYATKTLRLREEMLAALKQQETAATGVLRIGVTWEVSLDWIQPITRLFIGRLGNVRVELLCDHANNLIRDVREGRAAIAVLPGRPKPGVAADKLIVTRLARAKPDRPFWVARSLHGQSSLASTFEAELRAYAAGSRPIASEGSRVASQALRAVGSFSQRRVPSSRPKLAALSGNGGRSNAAVSGVRHP